MADDVSITFGASTDGFLAGVKQINASLATIGKAVEVTAFVEAGKAMIETINKVNEAIIEFGRSMAELGSRIESASESVGVTVERLQELAFAASTMDVSSQSLTFGMERLAFNMSRAEAGSKAEKDAFDRLGVSLTDSTGKSKDLDTVLNEVADSFARHANGAEKTALAIQVFGRAGAQMIPILNEGSAGLTTFAQKADATGGIFSQRLVGTMVDTNERVKTLDLSITGLKGRLFDVLKPVIDQVVNGFTKFVEGIQDAIVNNAGLQTALMGLVGAFEVVQAWQALLINGFVIFYEVGKSVFITLAQGFLATAKTIQDAMSLNWGSIAGEWAAAGSGIAQQWGDSLANMAATSKGTVAAVTADLSTFQAFVQQLDLLPLQIALDKAAATKAAGMGGSASSGLPSFAGPTDTSLADAQKKAVTDELANAQKQNDALRVHIETMGMATQAAATYTKQQEMLAAAVAKGTKLTQADRVAIDAEAQSYGALIAQAQHLATVQGVLGTLAQDITSAIGKWMSGNATLGQSFLQLAAKMAETVAEALALDTVMAGLSFLFPGAGLALPTQGLPGLLAPLFGGGKAEGGPLDMGKWYIAGERGPEPVWGGGPGAFAAGYGGGAAGGGPGGFAAGGGSGGGGIDHDALAGKIASKLVPYLRRIAGGSDRTIRRMSEIAARMR